MGPTDIAALWGAVLSTILAFSELSRGRPVVEIRGTPIKGIDYFTKELEVRIINPSQYQILIDRCWISRSDLKIRCQASSITSVVRGAMNEIENDLFVTVPAESMITLEVRWPGGGMPPERLGKRIFGILFWRRSSGGFMPTFPVFFQIGELSYQGIMKNSN
jgi:hypothetical protein